MRRHRRIPDGYGHGKFYFIEVNPRVQVEHTVTEEVTGIDIVQAQILIAEGKTLARPRRDAPGKMTSTDGHALQCRVTTEDPQNNFHPRLWPHHRLSRRHRHGHPP